MNEPSRPTLFIATSNPGKRSEFAHLLPPAIRLLTLDDIPVAMPPEDAPTFAENAATKAVAASRATGLLALADDSGLEVDALGGAPGVRSARYSGEPPDDERNRRHLVQALAAVPVDQRAARFRCVVVLARDGRVVATAEGLCEGAIVFAPRGSHGFGYDPLFTLANGRTMAELAPAEKNRLSHRARAMATIMPHLVATLGLPSNGESR